MTSPLPIAKSKTLTTWLALVGGSLGWHRLYLRGTGDLLAWLHGVPTAIGGYGVWRMLELGQDDRLAWLLIPVLGLMLSATQLLAIVYGLTPDDKWNARHNPQRPANPSGWGAVLGVVAALFVGSSMLMATLAFSMQRAAEYSLVEPVA